MLAPVTITRLEKAATDDGFDLDVERTADWLSFGSTQTSMRIWLTAIGESQFLAAMSRADVLDGLSGLGVAFTNPVPRRRRRRAQRQRRCHTPSPVAPRIPALSHAPGCAAPRLPRRNREPTPGYGSRTLGSPASWPGHLPPRSVGILGRPLCDHRPRGARAPTRQPHQALGRLRQRHGAPRRLQRPSAGVSSRCGLRRRFHHDRRGRNGARLEHAPSRRPVSPWT